MAEMLYLDFFVEILGNKKKQIKSSGKISMHRLAKQDI